MQPLLNASKVWKTIPAGSLKKRELSIKHTKNKLSLVTACCLIHILSYTQNV